MDPRPKKNPLVSFKVALALAALFTITNAHWLVSQSRAFTILPQELAAQASGAISGAGASAGGQTPLTSTESKNTNEVVTQTGPGKSAADKCTGHCCKKEKDQMQKTLNKNQYNSYLAQCLKQKGTYTYTADGKTVTCPKVGATDDPKCSPDALAKAVNAPGGSTLQYRPQYSATPVAITQLPNNTFDPFADSAQSALQNQMATHPDAVAGYDNALALQQTDNEQLRALAGPSEPVQSEPLSTTPSGNQTVINKLTAEEQATLDAKNGVIGPPAQTSPNSVIPASPSTFNPETGTTPVDPNKILSRSWSDNNVDNNLGTVALAQAKVCGADAGCNVNIVDLGNGKLYVEKADPSQAAGMYISGQNLNLLPGDPNAASTVATQLANAGVPQSSIPGMTNALVQSGQDAAKNNQFDTYVQSHLTWLTGDSPTVSATALPTSDQRSNYALPLTLPEGMSFPAANDAAGQKALADYAQQQTGYAIPVIINGKDGNVYVLPSENYKNADGKIFTAPMFISAENWTPYVSKSDPLSYGIYHAADNFGSDPVVKSNINNPGDPLYMVNPDTGRTLYKDVSAVIASNEIAAAKQSPFATVGQAGIDSFYKPTIYVDTIAPPPPPQTLTVPIEALVTSSSNVTDQYPAAAQPTLAQVQPVEGHGNPPTLLEQPSTPQQQQPTELAANNAPPYPTQQAPENQPPNAPSIPTPESPPPQGTVAADNGTNTGCQSTKCLAVTAIQTTGDALKNTAQVITDTATCTNDVCSAINNSAKLAREALLEGENALKKFAGLSSVPYDSGAAPGGQQGVTPRDTAFDSTTKQGSESVAGTAPAQNTSLDHVPGNTPSPTQPTQVTENPPSDQPLVKNKEATQPDTQLQPDSPPSEQPNTKYAQDGGPGSSDKKTSNGSNPVQTFVDALGPLLSAFAPNSFGGNYSNPPSSNVPSSPVQLSPPVVLPKNASLVVIPLNTKLASNLAKVTGGGLVSSNVRIQLPSPAINANFAQAFNGPSAPSAPVAETPKQNPLDALTELAKTPPEPVVAEIPPPPPEQPPYQKPQQGVVNTPVALSKPAQAQPSDATQPPATKSTEQTPPKDTRADQPKSDSASAPQNQPTFAPTQPAAQPQPDKSLADRITNFTNKTLDTLGGALNTLGKVASALNPLGISSANASPAQIQRTWNWSNLGKGIAWNGSVPCSGRQACFENGYYGARADFINMMTHIQRVDTTPYGPSNTLNGLMHTLSPPNENNTRGMITDLANTLKLQPNAVLDPKNEAQMVGLFQRKTFLEHSTYPSSLMDAKDITQAYKDALAQKLNGASPTPGTNSTVPGNTPPSQYKDGPTQDSGQKPGDQGRVAGVKVADPNNLPKTTSPSQADIANRALGNLIKAGQQQQPSASTQVTVTDKQTNTAYTCSGAKDDCLTKLSREVITARAVGSATIPKDSQIKTFTATQLPGTAPQKASPQQIDQIMKNYLYEKYTQASHCDSTGCFGWKDEQAAKRLGMSVKDYVIGGMNPTYRMQLYALGKKLDSQNIPWGINSGFRDDYRQGLITSGIRASVGNSAHGGSNVTCGYGCGIATDISGAKGVNNQATVWNAVDKFGPQVGLGRFISGDPSHLTSTKSSAAIANVKQIVADTTITPGPIYAITNPATGETVSEKTPLPAAAVGADGKVDLAIDPNGKILTDKDGRPLLVASDPAILPKATLDPNDNVYKFGDDRPSAPKPDTGGGGGFGGGGGGNRGSARTPIQQVADMFSPPQNQTPTPASAPPSAPSSGSAQQQTPSQTPTQIPASASPQCTNAPMPDPSGCLGGTWRPISSTNGASNCIASWQCLQSSPVTQPTAQIACLPNTAELGTPIRIAYRCNSNSTAQGIGFTAQNFEGFATTTITSSSATATSTTFQLTCVNAQNPNIPPATARCNVQIVKSAIIFVANPSTVHKGSASLLGWITSGMRSCIVSSPERSDFTKLNAHYSTPRGSTEISSIAKSVEAVLTCSTVGGSIKQATTSIQVQ